MVRNDKLNEKLAELAEIQKRAIKKDKANRTRDDVSGCSIDKTDMPLFKTGSGDHSRSLFGPNMDDEGNPLR